jgi:hypothetical protein
LRPSALQCRVLWLLAVLTLIFVGENALAETRVALVIGNGKYRAVPALANPPEDAEDVAAELKSLGFAVSLGVDLDLAGMDRAIAEFAKSAAEADVSLVYYGGHGLQVAGHNYLIPVDARPHNAQDIVKQTVHFDAILSALSQAKGLHLLFLDACRTNPLKDVSGPLQGLARAGDAAGFLIAFATQPDQVAYDGAGRNSPFAHALLDHIAAKGQDISNMMIEVRKDVIAKTGGAQIPWDSSSLTQQFYFAPGEASEGSPETLLWRLAAAQKDVDLLRHYLDRYPEGAHVADVKALIEASAAKSETGAAPTTPIAVRNVGGDDSFWNLAKSERQRTLVELYIKHYPNGAHRQEADALLPRLQDVQSADAPPEIICQQLATHPRDATAEFPGTELEALGRQADRAINACQDAVAKHPEEAHYVALLARANGAAGRLDEAVKFYKQAAEGGDARAMVSLGLLHEAGEGVPRDLKAAADLYAKAAARGSADGAINLAFALMKGVGVDRDTTRAVSLLKTASAGGSPIATYDLGVLAQQGVSGAPREALDFYRQSASLGDPRGYRAAAILLDEGRGVPKDPTGAADQLLHSVVGDAGDAIAELTSKTPQWSRDTIKAVQDRLKSAGYYSGPIDGKGGATLAPALGKWRLLGPPQKS